MLAQEILKFFNLLNIFAGYNYVVHVYGDQHNILPLIDVIQAWIVGWYSSKFLQNSV